MNRYESQHHDELGFEKGVLLEVFEKGIDGWWKARWGLCGCGLVGMGVVALGRSQQCTVVISSM